MAAWSLAGLDGFCQPGPTPRERQPPGGVGGPVESTADVAHQRMPDHEHRGGVNGLQPPHRSEALFQKPVVTFDAIGAVAASPMQNTRHRRSQRWGVRPALSVMTRRGVVRLEAMARSK